MLAPILLGNTVLCGIDLGVIDGRITASTAAGGLAAVSIHTGAHLLVATIMAVAIYETAGVRVLRRAWFNIDRVWAGVLIVTAIIVAVS
jgi:microsomal dipeptidase-like Zn-dependent dipeptidase